MPGYSGRLVDGDEQHAPIGVEDVVGPVAVVDVPVEDQDALGPVSVARPPRRHGDVVEEAEAHGARSLGVVARRAQRGDAGAGAPAEQRIDKRRRPARAAQRGLPRPLEGDRVGVDAGASPRAHLLQRRDVGLRVDRVDQLELRPRRLDALAAEPVVRRHLGLEGADPRRALRMAGHVVREVRVVAEPGRAGHAGTVGQWPRPPIWPSWVPGPPGSTRPCAPPARAPTSR